VYERSQRLPEPKKLGSEKWTSLGSSSSMLRGSKYGSSVSLTRVSQTRLSDVSTAAARNRAQALYDEKHPAAVKVPGKIADVVYDRLNGSSLRNKRLASEEDISGEIERQRQKSAKREAKVTNPRISFFNTFSGEAVKE
jgi:hypothetical protein